MNEIIEQPIINLVKTSNTDVQYISPTFIGSSVNEQKKLLTQLSAQAQLSDEQRRQKSLIELALFSNDKNQSLSKLEAISNNLDALSSDMPNDVEIMAAYGSALSYQAVFLQHNLGKMNFVSRKGMRLMDRAIKQAPNNLGVRLLRGVSYANMPRFLNRAKFAITDLSLIKQQSKSETNSDFLAFVNYYLAMALAKNEQPQQAKAIWQSLKNTASPAWQTKAIARLEEAE
ncbi:hypothetical protein [Pseudoalteromonas sp. NBT06-2]|uniref:hypothetical protein n=1 Tax=Pseudoalteromonas sp. NBT06-2 TaxID=2025950 RepID=UPI001140BB01|nr:hypothetical protein [Pseudoalteromonas sp. NBT06-2]